MTSSSSSSPLQFEAFSSAVDTAFWHSLASLKLDVFKLDDSSVRIVGSYSPGRLIGTSDALFNASHSANNSSSGLSPGPARVSVSGADAFRERDAELANVTLDDSDPLSTLMQPWTPLEFAAPGLLYNTNTQEEFKAADKGQLLKSAGDKLWNLITGDPSTILSRPSNLSPFILLTFADLKRFKFYFWFGFPAFLPSVPFTVSSTVLAKEILGEQGIEQLRAGFTELRKKSRHGDVGFFLVKKERSGRIKVASLGEYEEIKASLAEGDELLPAFVDPSALPNNPGWPLRNYLVFIRHHWNLDSCSVLCYRDLFDRREFPDSLVVRVNLPPITEQPDITGWERNAKGQLGPRLTDLGSIMDPLRLMDSAVDLNLKLMRWRALPDLDLAKISGTKCLLLGAGTLGCYVARTLMGWGVREITFVDNGKVSYSNPVRQPLFSFEDAKEGKKKAFAAAEALKQIYPAMKTTGIELSIPMPGHPIHDLAQSEKDIAQLDQLVQSHDAVFLLTDSRESRWLGTVMGRARNKIVVNAALGFDSYLVMRHGARGKVGNGGESGSVDPTARVAGEDLGCYFCSDVVAPKDSLSDRTLDQQCTVTRPGVAALAGSLASELLVSILTHPLSYSAPAYPPNTNEPEGAGSPLGIVPHQIRGFLGSFSQLQIVGRRFTECTACSDKVIDGYLSQGFEFTRKALEEPKWLEELTGLTDLHRRTEAIDVEGWDDEEEEGDGGSGDDFGLSDDDKVEVGKEETGSTSDDE